MSLQSFDDFLKSIVDGVFLHLQRRRNSVLWLLFSYVVAVVCFASSVLSVRLQVAYGSTFWLLFMAWGVPWASILSTYKPPKQISTKKKYKYVYRNIKIFLIVTVLRLMIFLGDLVTGDDPLGACFIFALYFHIIFLSHYLRFNSDFGVTDGLLCVGITMLYHSSASKSFFVQVLVWVTSALIYGCTYFKYNTATAMDLKLIENLDLPSTSSNVKRSRTRRS